MSDIKLNEPAAGKIPQYADTEASDNAPEAAQRPTTSAAESPAALMRHYLALLTRQQGQLPDEVAQKQQALLRLLSSKLDAAAVSGPNSQPAPLENQPLQQLLQRILPLLNPRDPLLNQPIMTRDNEPIPLRQLVTTPALVATLMQQLPASLQESSASGRALQQWLLQSLALRIPAEQLNRNLQMALIQQQITPPSGTTDKRLMANLEQLSRATLQFIWQSQSAGQTSANPASTTVTLPPAGKVTTPIPETMSGKPAAETAKEIPAEGAVKTSSPASASPPSAAGTAGHQQTAGITAGKGENIPLLQRMGALLQTQISTAPSQSQPISPQDALPAAVLPRMPLGAFIFEIGQHLAARQLPDILRPSLKRLYDALQSPLQQGDEVKQWFDFLQQPLSSSSSTGRALQQWALTLFSIRLQQLQSEADEGNRRQQQQSNPLLDEEHKQLTEKLATSLLGQTERFKQLHQETQQPLPTYVPLPPQQPGGRESGLSLQRSPGKQNPYQWTLSFFLEPPQLGAIQIRARLDIPDIQLQVMAERLTTVDKIRQTLPLLEGRFRELGLQPTPSICRQGKITHPSDTDGSVDMDETTPGLSIRI